MDVFPLIKYFLSTHLVPASGCRTETLGKDDEDKALTLKELTVQQETRMTQRPEMQCSESKASTEYGRNTEDDECHKQGDMAPVTVFPEHTTLTQDNLCLSLHQLPSHPKCMTNNMDT